MGIEIMDWSSIWVSDFCIFLIAVGVIGLVVISSFSPSAITSRDSLIEALQTEVQAQYKLIATLQRESDAWRGHAEHRLNLYRTIAPGYDTSDPIGH